MSWSPSWDIMDDLSEISEFGKAASMLPVRQIPVSARGIRIRSKPSIYDPEEIFDENEDDTIDRGRGLSIRGRGALGRRPGVNSAFLQNQLETRKKIREVIGIGFSNDVIEHALQANGNNDEFMEADKSSIKVSPVSSSLSTPTHSPYKQSSVNGLGKITEVESGEMPNIKLQLSPESSARSTPTHFSAKSTPLNNTTPKPIVEDIVMPPKVLPAKTTSPTTVSSFSSANVHSSDSCRGLYDIIKSANVKKTPLNQCLSKAQNNLQPSPLPNGFISTTSHSNQSTSKAERNVLRPTAEPFYHQRRVDLYDHTKRVKDKCLDINSLSQFPHLR